MSFLSYQLSDANIRFPITRFQLPITAMTYQTPLCPVLSGHYEQSWYPLADLLIESYFCEKLSILASF